MSTGKRFTALVAINMFAAFVAILLADGGPLSSMNGWKGLGLLVLMAIVIGGLAWMAFSVLTGDPISRKVALPLSVGIAVGGVLIVILFMGAGREWLKPIIEPFQNGGIWWPLVIIGASLLTWMLDLSGHNASTQRRATPVVAQEPWNA